MQSEIEKEYLAAKASYEKKKSKLYAEMSKKLERSKKKVKELESKFKKSGRCSHPEITKFKWEHDNGYGVQTMLDGLQCKICNKINHWPHPDGSGGQWSNPEDL